MTDPRAAGPAVILEVVADLTGPYGDHLALDRGGKRWALTDGLTLQLGGDGTLERKLAAPEPIHHLAWSSDGTRLLASPQIYDPAADAWAELPDLDRAMTGGLDAPPPPEQLGVAAAAHAPDGRELVIATCFQPSRQLDAVESYTGPRQRLLLLGPDRELRGALYAGDGEVRAIAVGDRLIAAGGATVQVWERASMRKLADLEHERVARALAFNAAGEILGVITADGRVSLWDLTSSHLLAAFPAHRGGGDAIAFHPRQPIVATGGQDGTLQLWSLDGGSLRTEALGGWVRAVAFDPTGARLGAVVRDRPPRLVLYAVSTSPRAQGGLRPPPRA